MGYYYKHLVLEILGGRVVVLGIGDAMQVANEICQHFSAKKSNGESMPSPAETFLAHYNKDVARWNNGQDKNLMHSGAVTFNLGGFYVIHFADGSKFSVELLVHELFHVVDDIAKSCGIMDTEFNAHLGQYLFEKFTDFGEHTEKQHVQSDGLIQPELF